MEDYYVIYKHTFIKTNKSYIGYTKYSISERLHKHNLNAMMGIDTKFYRAIRKYGIDNIISKELEIVNSQDDAKEKEKYYIAKYNTFKDGYNMTLGGDGGDVVTLLPKGKYEKYINRLKEVTGGENNPRFSGVTDREILEESYKFFLKERNLIFKKWKLHCKMIGFPQSYSKCRFNSLGYRGLIKLLKDKLVENNIFFCDNSFKYTYTDEHRKKVGVNKNKVWYNNGIENFFILKDSELIKTNNLIKGKINVKNRKNKRTG